MTNTLRLGVLTPVQGGDPRVSGDFVNLVVRWQVYEAAFQAKVEGGVESCLLEWPLRPEPAEGERPVYSAAVVPGRRFSNGSRSRPRPSAPRC
jgi:hypothetical protein